LNDRNCFISGNNGGNGMRDSEPSKALASTSSKCDYFEQDIESRGLASLRTVT
jgi:hypothetical protein